MTVSMMDGTAWTAAGALLSRPSADLTVRVETSAGAWPGYPATLLDTILRSASYAIVTLDPAGLVTGWNEGASLILGWAGEEMLGQPATRFFTPEDNERGVLDDVLRHAGAKARCTAERWHMRKDGTAFWSTEEVVRIDDAHGRAAGFVAILCDRSGDRPEYETRRIEEHVLGRLRASSPDTIEVMTLDGSPLAAEAGRTHVEDAPPAGRDGWASAGLDALETARGGGTGRFRRRDPAQDRDWDVAVTPILGFDGEPERLLSVTRETSDLKRAERRHAMLMQELSHRVKNTFAMVQAIASQTLGGPDVPSGLRDDFFARLLALSHAHDVLMQHDWTAARLRDIVEGIARLHGLRTSDRFRIEGPSLMLGPRLALSFALVLHELGTNAIKYGALSTARGCVAVTWCTDEGRHDPRFSLRWVESGGPVVRPPAHKGFGSRLIAHSFPASGGITSALSFAPQGVTFSMEAPLALVQQA